jgi:hypothetical protein
MNLCVNGLPAHKEELGMTKHGKVLPARRLREDDDSILLRSAETVGRVIGTLQRQLDGARGRLSGFVLDSESADGSNGSRSKPKASRKSGAAKARKATAVVRTMSTARKTTRPTRAKRAAKATTARTKTKR